MLKSHPDRRDLRSVACRGCRSMMGPAEVVMVRDETSEKATYSSPRTAWFFVRGCSSRDDASKCNLQGSRNVLDNPANITWFIRLFLKPCPGGN